MQVNHAPNGVSSRVSTDQGDIEYQVALCLLTVMYRACLIKDL